MVAGQPEEQREKTAGRDARRAREGPPRAGAASRSPPTSPSASREADGEIFAGLRAMLGLDQVKAIHVGAAPTPVEVLEFFHAIGLPLAELWGMSETCGAGAANPPEKIKIGTVGPPAPGVEIKLAEDGEVLIRSDVVMLGYRNLPEKTAEVMTDDGFLRTGDIGELDEDSYLTIVDRKKEIIINAAGKNMSPANIEAALKASSPLIGQAACIGDGRSYNTALIVLDSDFAPAWAAQHGIEDASLEALAHNDAHARGRAGGRRRRQRQARARRADQEVHDRRGRLAAGRRRADADDEAQAQADRREVRRDDRGDVREVAAAAVRRSGARRARGPPSRGRWPSCGSSGRPAAGPA